MIPTDEEIYAYFLGEIVIGDMYRSPLPDRPKNDTAPSFGIYEKDGRVLWKDFGFADASGNKPVNFVMDYLKVSYGEAMRIIENEVKAGMFGKQIVLQKRRRGDRLPLILKRDKFTPAELKYWEDHGIEEEDLRRENIYALEGLTWIGEGTERSKVEKSTDTVPVFVYWFGDSPASWKKYRPEAKDRRGKVIAAKDFLTWNVSDVLEGWDTFPEKTDLTIITSSTKDRLCVKKCGYAALNPHGENAHEAIMNRRDEINLRSSKTLIIFDADEPGYKASRKLSELTGWPFVDVRGKLKGQKDFAEYALKYGIDSLTELLKTLTNG